MEMPKAVNVRSPLAIKRCVELVEQGDARNLSEAADTLILLGFQSERKSQEQIPVSSGSPVESSPAAPASSAA